MRITASMIFLALIAVLCRADDPALRRIDTFELEDFSWVERGLKRTPAFTSANVRYAIWVMGSSTKSVMTMAWDESGGTGTGYDTLYADRNFNRDLTEPDERFFYANPAPKGQKPPQGKSYEHYEIKGIREAGGGLTFDLVFDSAYNHDTIEYNSAYTVRGSGVNYTVSNLPWSMKLMWGPDLQNAPIYRLGGTAEPIVSYQQNRDRRLLFAGEALGTWNAGQDVQLDILVAHIGSGRDVQLRFSGSKFPGVGKGIQSLRWGGGGYPLAVLRVLNAGGGVREEIPFNPGCP